MSKKICFAASTGGHFEQLMMLKPLMDKYECFVLTEEVGYNLVCYDKKVYCVKQVNRREKSFIFKMLAIFFKSLKIYIKEKPDVIITTGVLAVIPMCLIAKLFRKKLIYIESFAKISSPTLTGKLLYKFADQFYIQWEELKEFYPNSIYKGGIY